jgi:hypothetical protein
MLTLDGEALQMVIHVPALNEDAAATVCGILLLRYERNTVASKLHLRRMLHNSRMSEVESFDSFLSRVQEQLCLRLLQMGSEVNAEEKL